LNLGEREFAISPIYGSLVMQAINNKPINEHKFWTYKKPFDWMLDEQYLNLQVQYLYGFIKPNASDYLII
jgi:dynein heavy chain